MLPNKKEKENFLSFVFNLKKEYNIKIVDTHVHPMDVMGILHPDNYDTSEKEIENNIFANPSFGEKFGFGIFSHWVINFAYKHLPKAVDEDIKKSYLDVSEKRFFKEMEKALIDEVVFLPVEPWSSIDRARKFYKNKRFFLLASFDIQKQGIEDIERKLKQYRDEGCIGIKLHPNLQKFLPIPEENSEEIREKLELIYSLAEEYNMYIVFHVGKSGFPININKKFKNRKRSKTNALLNNFYNDKNNLFSRYNINFIIAHLGHFGLGRINKNLIKRLVENNENVFFDTAAVSPKMIRDFIKVAGSDRLVLGSDAIYNRMFNAMFFVYKAVENREDKEEIMVDILGRNFYTNFLKDIR